MTPKTPNRKQIAARLKTATAGMLALTALLSGCSLVPALAPTPTPTAEPPVVTVAPTPEPTATPDPTPTPTPEPKYRSQTSGSTVRKRPAA